jgi:hypothetical protein
MSPGQVLDGLRSQYTDLGEQTMLVDAGEEA